MKKRLKRKKGFFNKQVKKTLPYQLLVISLILLSILILIWVVLFILGKVSYLPKDEGLEGELGTISPWGLDELGDVFPKNCSNESLQNAWEGIFYETYSNIYIKTKEMIGNRSCGKFELIKYINEDGYDKIYSIIGTNFISLDQRRFWLVSEFFELTDENNNQALNYSEYQSYPKDIIDYLLNYQGRVYKNRTKSIITINEAMSESENYFKKDVSNSSNWFNYSGYDYINFIEGDAFTDSDQIFVFRNLSRNSILFMRTDENLSYLKNPILNFTMVKNSGWDFLIDLRSYFNCSFSLFSIYNLSGNDISISFNIDSEIGFKPKTDFVGEERFFIQVLCSEGYQNSNEFYIFIVENETANNPPEFLDEDCDDLEWKINTNYSIDMDNCFDDDDGDDLDFRYMDASGYNDNLTIELDDDNLILIPDDGWTGSGYFYIYADDSTDETSGRVYFSVLPDTSSPTTSISTSTPTSNILKIKSSSPSSSTVNIFTNKTKKFSITAQNYDSIKWYLDGKMVLEGGLSYNFKETAEGNYVIKVEVVNGTVTDSKTWNLTAQEEIKDNLFESGEVIFYLIVGIILIIIFLVLWLFLVEKNSRKTKINYIGFGVSGSS